MITQLKPRYAAKTRIDVYVNEQYLLTCEKRLAQALGLHEGMAFDEQWFWQRAAADELDAALERMYTYLEGGMRSEKQLADKLKLLGFDTAICEPVLEKLKAIGFLDDESFAKNHIAQRISRNSAARIRRELMGKGIDRELVYQLTAQQTDPEQELQKCKAVLRKYLSKPGVPQENRRKGVAACQRAGYSWQEISGALAALGEEVEFSE